MRLIRSSWALLALMAPSLAFAQATLLQGGPWTPGHAPMYVGQGGSQPIVQDGGGAGGGAVGVTLSELGITARSSTNTYPSANSGSGQYSTHACMYDAPTVNATGFHYLCLDPNAQGGGLLAYGAAGGASNLPFSFIVNGTTYGFPFTVGGIVGPGSTTVGHIATWNNTTGSLLADGGALTFSAISGNATLAQMPILAANSVMCNATSGSAVPTACTTLPSGLTIPGPSLGAATGTSFVASTGLVANGTYAGSFSHGIVADYTSGTARLSTGTTDQFCFYNGGVAANQLACFNTSGGLVLGSALAVAYGGTGVTSASGTALDNITAFSSTGIMSRASAGSYTFSSLSALMDTAFSSTQGSIVYRGASGWVALAPGTSGQYLKTQGAAANPVWATSTAPTLLNTLTAGNTPALQDTTSLTASYSEYDIIFENVIPATNTTTCELQVYASGGYQATTYVTAGYYSNVGGATQFGANTTFIPCSAPVLTANSAPGISGAFHFSNPSQTTQPKMFNGQVGYNATTSTINSATMAGYWNGSNVAVTGFQVLFSSGNITSGTIKIYGHN